MVIDILLYISTYSEKKKGLGTLRYSKSKKKKEGKMMGISARQHLRQSKHHIYIFIVYFILSSIKIYRYRF